jgi:hypothetical protein
MTRPSLTTRLQAALCSLLVAGLVPSEPPARAQNAPPGTAAIAEYQARLAQFQAARAPYEAQAAAYWDAIAAKRRGRNAKRRDHLPMTLDD